MQLHSIKPQLSGAVQRWRLPELMLLIRWTRCPFELGWRDLEHGLREDQTDSWIGDA